MEYTIIIYFEDLSLYSIDDKMSVLRMIDTLNANSKVEEVVIEIHSDNQYNDKIITRMMNNYSNLYSITMHNWNDQVDRNIHNMIKQWV